ncbi:hypothetical protein AX16_008672 [Volvariella volvacea WC 439]|nr:hypothetical protein AX16_008672 [Volvariella volvacea WC 439]
MNDGNLAQDGQPSPHSARRHAIQQDPQHWQPALGPILDDNLYEQDLRPPPSLALMQHSNRSVPSLPSEQPPHYDSNPPPLPSQQRPYDPAAVLDSFNALHVSNPIPRTPSAMSRASDPVPRAPSSMSMHSLYSQRGHNYPRHANTMPPPPGVYRSHTPAQDMPPLDYSMVHAKSAGSYYDNYSAERGGPYPQHAANPPGSVVDTTYPVSGQEGSYPSRWHPPPTDYNPLYAAASNVLGMGPPPGTHSLMHPPTTQTQYPDGMYPGRSQPPAHNAPPHPAALAHAPVPSTSTASYGPEDDDIHPPMHRSGTSASVALSSQKSKAIDLTAPPYTKEYIDQYRQRIKADPDPEAHFLFAKYLIDAAKHIRSTARDQRAGKRYSEVLVADSLKVVKKLATQGEGYDEAQFFLANCYGTGTLGLQVDHERAYHLYLQAAKQNHPAACYRVAVCNEIGAGTRKDASRAAAFYRKAASLGDTAAMYKLGMILLNGLLEQQPSPREAINWLKRAAEQADEENPHALHELGLLYESQDPTLLPYDPVLAKNLFTQAAQLGYTQSQFKLGQCYEYGTLGCPVDPRRSIAWYTKAAEKGDSEAELALSGWYLTGSEGVLKQSDSEAYLWARRAAGKGLSKAEYAVGYYAEVGIGVKQDIEFAKKWYMRAATQGNKRAMNRLTEIKRMGNKRINMARPTRQEAKDECIIC